MTAICQRLKNLLDQNKVEHEVVCHRRDYTALETAADSHTPGIEFAKSVVVSVDGKSALAVLPAHHIVDERKLAHALGARRVRLAPEETIQALFPDCELGAEPPFGNLYGLPVYLSEAMAGDARITFNAGSHESVVRMSMADFRRLAGPQVLDFSIPRKD